MAGTPPPPISKMTAVVQTAGGGPFQIDPTRSALVPQLPDSAFSLAMNPPKVPGRRAMTGSI